MGLKKKSKVSAEFNMSSLTDIIFLLLIFFMLTSSLIVPNALNLKLPGKTSSAPPSNTKPTVIGITAKGSYTINGALSKYSTVEKKIRSYRNKKNKTITISPNKKSPNHTVIRVMDAAFRYGVPTILTDPQ